MTISEYKKRFKVGAYEIPQFNCCRSCKYAFKDKHDGRLACYHPLIGYPEVRMIVGKNVTCSNFRTD